MSAGAWIALIGLILLVAVLIGREHRKHERNGSLWCGPGGREVEMMKLFVLFMFVFLFAAGCTQKGIKINLDEGATLTINGEISPEFLRDGTTETTSPQGSLTIPYKLK